MAVGLETHRYFLGQLCVCQVAGSLMSLRHSISYRFYYPPGTTGNEVGASDPVFMRKYGEELKKDSGKWIDSSVWHGKAHSWEKMPWVIKEVSILKSVT